MSTSPQDFNARIIEEFHANDGRVGGPFEGAPCSCCTTSALSRAQERINPLVYRQDGDRYVIFASKGGAPTNPDWYHNLKANPNVTIEVGTDTIDVVAGEAAARSATGCSRPRPKAPELRRVPGQGTDRVIPVIVLTPR